MQPDPWMSKVRRGDKLRPISLWNKSTGSKGSRLPDEVKVTGVVVSSMSQSGLMFRVQNNRGQNVQLDAAWFCNPSLN